MNWDVTLGLRANPDFYHINVIRTTLTRNIGIKFPDILDEISTAFNEHIPASGGEYDAWFFCCFFAYFCTQNGSRSRHIQG